MTKPKNPSPPENDIDLVEARYIQRHEVLVIGHQKWELQIVGIDHYTRNGKIVMNVQFDHPGIVLEISPNSLVKVKKPTL